MEPEHHSVFGGVDGSDGVEVIEGLEGSEGLIGRRKVEVGEVKKKLKLVWDLRFEGMPLWLLCLSRAITSKLI